MICFDLPWIYSSNSWSLKVKRSNRTCKNSTIWKWYSLPPQFAMSTTWGSKHKLQTKQWLLFPKIKWPLTSINSKRKLYLWLCFDTLIVITDSLHMTGCSPLPDCCVACLCTPPCLCCCFWLQFRRPRCGRRSLTWIQFGCASRPPSLCLQGSCFLWTPWYHIQFMTTVSGQHMQIYIFDIRYDEIQLMLTFLMLISIHTDVAIVCPVLKFHDDAKHLWNSPNKFVTARHFQMF